MGTLMEVMVKLDNYSYEEVIELTNQGKEIWRTIVGYSGYEVSNLGRVRSLDRFIVNSKGVKYPLKGKLFSLKPHKSQGGYVRVTLQGQKEYVHRLVARAFIPNPENKPHINHIKGKERDNNKVTNLEWCTPVENSTHALTTGLKSKIAKGSTNGKSKLSEKDVLEIVNLIDHTCISYESIASKFNVNASVISRINSGKAWNHLTNRKGK